MKRTTRISRSAWVGLLLSLGLAGGSWIFTQVLRPLPTRVAEPSPVPERPAQLAGLRERQRERSRLAWDAPRLHAFQLECGNQVQWEERPRVRDERRFRIRVSADGSPWRDGLALLRRLDAEPGIFPESLDLAAAGAGRTRHFTQFVLDVAAIAAPETPHPSNPNNR